MSHPFAAAGAAALQDAADLARLAPSVHNTQPWMFEIDDDRLAVRADRRRQVGVIDPLGRALTLSVGAALLNARVALAAAGWDAHPQLLLRIGRAAPTTATPRRKRSDVVRGVGRPDAPASTHPHPEPRPEQPAHPAPDGRGGTVWVR